MFYFEVEVYGDVLSDGAKPILDDSGKLIGGFTLKEGSKIACFLSSTDHQVALHVSAEMPFFFTCIEDNEGKITSGVVSDVILNSTSVRVEPTQIRG